MLEQSCLGLAAQRDAGSALGRGQPAGSACMGYHQLRHSLGKGAPGATGIAAVDSSHPQGDPDATPQGYQIREMTIVTAVNVTAGAPAIRAAPTRMSAAGINLEVIGIV